MINNTRHVKRVSHQMLSPARTACCWGFKSVSSHISCICSIRSQGRSRQGGVKSSDSQTEDGVEQPEASSSQPLTVLPSVSPSLLPPRLERLPAEPARVLLCFLFVFSDGSANNLGETACWPKPLENTLHHSHKTWFTLFCHPQVEKKKKQKTKNPNQKKKKKPVSRGGNVGLC